MAHSSMHTESIIIHNVTTSVDDHATPPLVDFPIQGWADHINPPQERLTTVQRPASHQPKNPATHRHTSSPVNTPATWLTHNPNGEGTMTLHGQPNLISAQN
ncbi:hypothetical protein HPP92_020101 [Vanilla planifolia]|uniref:Uncharacterized protein n=1 Tax=Vanilla planifolia TaxID=51239 RepID=A0A835ULE4_VANPL|nr:hypothetical protein HPP92_020101 [Vanilla planifolia]